MIRFDTEGKSVELVAGGLCNAYDLAFHPNGRLYVHDSDMESDEGSAWYRPTSLYEVSEGAEYGCAAVGQSGPATTSIVCQHC
ncbi:MAG: hypothetical protein R3C56_28765 [Pirellulaceae bacterium]